MSEANLKHRIETAEGPSRELDCVLIKLVYGVNPYPTAYPEQDWMFYTDDEPTQRVPNFTGSVDAGLTLVERVLPGWSWRIGNRPNGGAWVILGTSRKEHLGATPALAILSALLSAILPLLPSVKEDDVTSALRARSARTVESSREVAPLDPFEQAATLAGRFLMINTSLGVETIVDLEACIRSLATYPRVSDEQPMAEDPKGLSLQGASAICEAETPLPTPLQE